MTVFILGFLYAVLMVAVGINEIFLNSTGKSEFLSCLMLTFSVSLLLVVFVWQFSAKINK